MNKQKFFTGDVVVVYQLGECVLLMGVVASVVGTTISSGDHTYLYEVDVPMDVRAKRFVVTERHLRLSDKPEDIVSAIKRRI